MKHRTKGNNSNGSGTKNASGKGSLRSAGASGKGKGVSKSGGSSGGAALDLKDIPLALPNMTVTDHSQWVPRYHAVIQRTESDGVRMEDLDTLQLELEAMLAASVVRKFTLTREIDILNNADKYRGKNQGKKGPSSPGKRGQGSNSGGSSLNSNQDSIKRFKSATGKPTDPSKIIGLPKIKSDVAVTNFDPLQNEQIRPSTEASKPTLPKNETPNRFWSFVEPYCSPITVEDIKLLEDLIKSHNELNEYYRIPSLGVHYTQRWAKEDLENERSKSSGNDVSNGDKSGNEGGKLLSKVENTNEESAPYGDLTQRLVGGLMEENIMTPVEESIEPNPGKRGAGSTEGQDHENTKPNLIRSLNIANPEGLEARIRKELEDLDILNPNDDEDKVDNDEILDELKRCQIELKAVSAHNLMQLKRLLKAAKEEMVKQELRAQLQKADQEVMEAYQKISAARSKKKPPTKKERENAWKALKERELILQKLETV